MKVTPDGWPWSIAALSAERRLLSATTGHVLTRHSNQTTEASRQSHVFISGPSQAPASWRATQDPARRVLDVWGAGLAS